MATEVFRKRISTGSSTSSESTSARPSGELELIVLENVTADDTVLTSLPGIKGVLISEHASGVVGDTLAAYIGLSTTISSQTITIKSPSAINDADHRYVSLLVVGA